MLNVVAGGLSILVGIFSALLSGLVAGLTWIVTRPFHITALGVWMALTIVVYFNAPFLFVDPDRATEILSVYLLFVALAMAGDGPESNPMHGVSAGVFGLFLMLSVAISGFLFSWLQPINPDVSPVVDGTWFGFVWIAAFTIAFGEEMMFRGPLAKMLGGGMGGQVLSAIAFGAAHVYAYSLQATTPLELGQALAFVTVLGLFFGYLTWAIPQIGFVLSVGFHTGWNLFTMGILGNGA